MSSHDEAVQLKRIADSLEILISKEVVKSMDTNASTLFQLAGSCAGFADELDSILQQPDQFKRANQLRDLQRRARRIANTYAEQAEEASAAERARPDSKAPVV